MKNFLQKTKTFCLGEPREFDPGRRTVLKGAAALAAVAVVSTSSPGIYKALDSFSVQSLTEQMVNGGVIENQIFYVKGTVVLEDISHLIIRNCTFIIETEYCDDYAFFFGENCHYCQLINSTFEMRPKRDYPRPTLSGAARPIISNYHLTS